MLVILEKLPDTSEFKTHAVRKGDWTIFQKMAAETHREIAMIRSSYLQSHGVEGDDVLFYPFESPAEGEARSIEDEFSDDEREDFYDSLFGN